MRKQATEPITRSYLRLLSHGDLQRTQAVLGPRVVDKLLMERCEFLLIVPLWRSRPWFQALEEFVFPRAQLFMLVPPGNVVDNNRDAFFAANGQFNMSMVVVHFVP